MSMNQYRNKLPAPLLERFDEVELKFSASSWSKKEKIAAFDLDNTLLIGDIGEAAFIQLKLDQQQGPLAIDGSTIPFSWQDYDALLQENKKEEAFTQMVASYENIPKETIEAATARVMNCGLNEISAEGGCVPVPRPNPITQAFIHLLQALDYTIYVISASQQLCVQYVAKKYFNIPETNVIAMRNTLKTIDGRSVLTAQVEKPWTVGQGKAVSYHHFVGSTPPLITAGDSTTDLPVLDLTDPNGLIVWVGGDEKKWQYVREQLTHPHCAWWLQRSQFDK